MKTKTLLIAAVVLAAGALPSQAQVYSQNIVGYVNVPTPGGQFALISNPLDNGTNNLTSLFPLAPNGTVVEAWTGTGYQLATKSFAGWTTNLVLEPGQGFFVNFASPVTNTFVGSVSVQPGSSVTNTLQANVFYLVASTIPYGDSLTGTNLNLPQNNGTVVQVWNGSTFTLSTKSFGGWTTGLNITPGQGFFLQTPATVDWVQTMQ